MGGGGGERDHGENWIKYLKSQGILVESSVLTLKPPRIKIGMLLMGDSVLDAEIFIKRGRIKL